MLELGFEKSESFSHVAENSPGGEGTWGIWGTSILVILRSACRVEVEAPEKAVLCILQLRLAQDH